MERQRIVLADSSLAAGQTFDFALGGVSMFEILGIHPNADLNPLDTMAFIIALTFEGDGNCTGTQTPITTDVTPIPATLPLFAGGLSVLGMLGWRRKRKAQSVVY